jgi:mono/diheme cytochrome c family protein
MFLTPVCSIILIAFNNSVAIDKTTMERGKKVYIQYCMACHQVDGSGVPGLNPPLEKTPHVLGSKTKLIKIILKGMDTHEEIDGEIYSKCDGSAIIILRDQQIADVLTYVRNMFWQYGYRYHTGDVKYVRERQNNCIQKSNSVTPFKLAELELRPIIAQSAAFCVHFNVRNVTIINRV